MLESLNILHLVLALGGAGCLYAAVLETRRRAIPRGQLFLPPALALLVATVVTLAQSAMDQPPWIFAAALVIGLALGGARGLRMPLKVDQYWLLLRVRPAAKRLLLWVVALVAADAALECAAAIASQPLETWRLVGALLAVACTGMLWGRAAVVAVRMRLPPTLICDPRRHGPGARRSSQALGIRMSWRAASISKDRWTIAVAVDRVTAHGHILSRRPAWSLGRPSWPTNPRAPALACTTPSWA